MVSNIFDRIPLRQEKYMEGTSLKTTLKWNWKTLKKKKLNFLGSTKIDALSHTRETLIPGLCNRLFKIQLQVIIILIQIFSSTEALFWNSKFDHLAILCDGLEKNSIFFYNWSLNTRHYDLPLQTIVCLFTDRHKLLVQTNCASLEGIILE